MGAIPYDEIKKPKEPKKKKPLRAKKLWNPVRKPIPKINVEATKKRKKRRAAKRNSPEEKAVRAEAWIVADGICQCGCGQPFDKSGGQYSDDYPEFHHTGYDPPKGFYARRICHHYIEMTEHPTRIRNY